MNSTTKEVDRMNKNVEALQWRIKNNFAVPVESTTHESGRQEYNRQHSASLQVQDRLVFPSPTKDTG